MFRLHFRAIPERSQCFGSNPKKPRPKRQTRIIILQQDFKLDSIPGHAPVCLPGISDIDLLLGHFFKRNEMKEVMLCLT